MKTRSLLSFGVSLAILGTSSLSVKAQKAATNRPNAALVMAIRNAVGKDLSNLFNRIEYFFTEVDLNNDGNREVVVYTAGIHCGAYECPVYIFTMSGNSYRLIGKTAGQSNNAQIAILPSKSNGWLDFATLVYDSQQRRNTWKLHRFDRKNYQNTYQDLRKIPNQIALRPNRGSGISLAKPGIASSQIATGRSPSTGQRAISGRSQNSNERVTIPAKTNIPVSVVGNATNPLRLRIPINIVTSQGTVLIPAETEIVGELRSTQGGSQFVAKELILRNGQRLPINATSEVITGSGKISRLTLKNDLVLSPSQNNGQQAATGRSQSSRRTQNLSQDFGSHWALVYMQALVAKGILTGFPGETYNPDAPITRAQFAAIVSRAFNRNPIRNRVNFSDVPSNYWASKEIAVAYQTGFLTGYPGNVFRPEQTIPKEQVLMAIVNGLNLEYKNTQSFSFYKDADRISSYARNPIATATDNQLVVNYPNPRQLNPNGEATLGEVAAFVYQALVMVGKAQPINSPYLVAVERSPSTGGQTTSGRSLTPSQTYRDTKSLGMAQFLHGNRELISAQERLQRAAKGEYNIVNIPITDFLTKPFTSVGTSRCKPLLGCERDPVSYADYLKLKLKLKAQETVFNGAVSLLKEIDPYNDKLNKDNRFGGRDVSQRIVSNFNEYWKRVEEQTKNPSLSLESIGRALPYALEETRVSTLALIQSSFKAGGKLASAFTNLGGLIQILNLPELKNPESFQRAGRSLEYVITVRKKLDDVQDAVKAGNTTELNNITLEIASETIKLINAQDSRLVRSAEAIAIRSEATKLIERNDFFKQSQLTGVLDGFDKTYLTTAQASSAVKIITSTLAFIAPGKKAVRTLADKADAVNALLFDALEFSYKDDVQRQYERMKVYSDRRQKIISGLSSSINFSAQEVGQYLIKSRSDVVTRRPNGTIAVSADGVLYPQ